MIKHRMLPWSNPPWHKSLTYRMVRTRGLVYCPALPAVTWQMLLATIHHRASAASYPFCHSCALFFTTLGSPCLHPISSHITQLFPFGACFATFILKFRTCWYHYQVAAIGMYCQPGKTAPLMIFNAPLPLPVTFSYFSHNSCLTT